MIPCGNLYGTTLDGIRAFTQSQRLDRPAPNIFPTALNFGEVPVGKTSSPKNIKLTNTGNSRLKITKIDKSGHFFEQNNCGTGLGIGKSCAIQISFKPTIKGVRTGNVIVVDNAPGSPQKIRLSGIGK